MRVRTLTSRVKRRSYKRSPRLEYRTLEYLTEISLKYGVEPNVFFDKIVKAWRGGESTYKHLTFECRKATKHYAIFLITTESKVVTQFRLSVKSLLEANPLQRFTARAKFAKKKRQRAEEIRDRHGEMQIKDLHVGMKRVNIRAKVLEISPPRMVATRFGFYATIANALVADETGNIQLPLWNRQINEVSVGDFIHVEKADVIVFRGTRQLKIARNGSINVINV